MVKRISLGELVARFGGRVVGDGNTIIGRLASLESAETGDLAFLSNPRYAGLLSSTRASAVIITAERASDTTLPCIITDNPYLYFAQVARLMAPSQTANPGIHRTAIIDDSASISKLAEVAPYAVVGKGASIADDSFIGAGSFIGDGVTIGRGCIIHPRVTILHECQLGERCILHPGCVIGADGFGLARQDGAWLKIPQTGRVIIGNDVEVGANTTIDRGALNDTIIENGVKLDNQIQIGHNVTIGEHSALAGCVGIAGSARIGRRCTLGGGAIVVGHIAIADDVHLSAGTLVTKSITTAGQYGGPFPFSGQAAWRRSAALVRNLGAMDARLRSIERSMQEHAKPEKAKNGGGDDQH